MGILVKSGEEGGKYGIHISNYIPSIVSSDIRKKKEGKK